MTKVGLSFLLLFYLYPLTLNILPFLSSRKLMAFLGMLLLMIRFSNKIYNREFFVKKELVYIFLSLFLIASISVITVIYNGTSELQFVSYVISNVIIFVSSYFVVKLISNTNNEISDNFLIKLVVYSIALQCLISITMHFVPPLKDLILSISALDVTQAEKIDALSSDRVIGFGLTFFWAGAYCGMGLILIAYLIKYSYVKNNEILRFVFLYAFIFLVGMMMARTTIIGAVLSIILLLFPNRINLKTISYKSVKFFGLLFVAPILLISSIYIIFPNLFLKINYLIEFAFEMFINLKKSGELETDSTDVLMQMFVMPDNLKTWIIGDGYWTSPVGDGYYMHTDVGFLRTIYYFGIVGLLSLVLSQFLILKASFNKNLILLIIFAYFIILNVKGFFEYTPFCALLISAHYQFNKSQRINEN